MSEQLFDNLILSLKEFSYHEIMINKTGNYVAGTIKKIEATIMLIYNLTIENPILLIRVINNRSVYEYLYDILKLYLTQNYKDYCYDTTEEPVSTIDEFIREWLLEEDDDTYEGNDCYNIFGSTKNVIKRMLTNIPLNCSPNFQIFIK